MKSKQQSSFQQYVEQFKPPPIQPNKKIRVPEKPSKFAVSISRIEQGGIEPLSITRKTVTKKVSKLSAPNSPKEFKRQVKKLRQSGVTQTEKSGSSGSVDSWHRQFA